MLAYVTGMVNQELLLRNEYLAAENRILRGQIKGRLLLSEGEKATLAEIAHRLGREALEHLAATANPDTILGWYRKLVANKFDGSRFCRRAGRPRMNEEIERLVAQMAKENPGWGYDRIVGAMANLGHRLSDQTIELSGGATGWNTSKNLPNLRPNCFPQVIGQRASTARYAIWTRTRP
jgi:putative transposase